MDLLSLGITGNMTVLGGAMMVSSPNIVSLLLEHGADPYECDISGNDPFMFASIFGRTDNVKFWLKRFPDWDLERKNKVVGGVALGHAVYMGPHRLELVKIASRAWSFFGLSHRLYGRIDLHGFMLKRGCDPELLAILLKKKMKSSVNYRLRGRTL